MQVKKNDVRWVAHMYVEILWKKLNIKSSSIHTSKDVERLAEKMKEHHFKDDNGKEITPIGSYCMGRR